MTYKNIRMELQKNKARIIKDINKQQNLHIPWNFPMTISGVNLEQDTAIIGFGLSDFGEIEFSIKISSYIKKGDKK